MQNRKSDTAGLLRADWLWVFVLLLFVVAPAWTLRSQPGMPNRVLDLDGQGDYVRLPSGGFPNLSQVTIEGWTKWRSFNASARFFDFGEQQREMYVGSSGASGGGG